VLLLHGWTGEASFMGAFADYLRRRGYGAVLMDMPGHGRSDGQRASLFDCATAVVEVSETISPIRFVVGHSIGAMAALAAAEGHPPLSRWAYFDAYVLISMPNAFADVTREFGRKLGLSPAAQCAFERRLEGLAQRRIQEFTGSGLLRAIGRPTLLLHSRDDQEVPFACSEAMAASMPHVALAPFDGLGHRAILYAPPAIRISSAFFDGQGVQR
jgi:pimeloyl-ACP methyl ester carboxylesterase